MGELYPGNRFNGFERKSACDRTMPEPFLQPTEHCHPCGFCEIPNEQRIVLAENNVRFPPTIPT